MKVQNKEKKRTKLLSGILFSGFTAMAVCILLLFFTALIPQSAIRESTEESADYYMETPLFAFLIEGQFNTRQDNYADAILVNIMYHIDGEDLPGSLIKASYYNEEKENVNVSLQKAMEQERQPNIDYFRYWHGSMVLLRPLFLLTSIVGARMILGILLGILTLLTAVFLYKQKEKALAICYLLGNLAVQSWMLVFCVEYVTTFLVMNGICIAELLLYRRWKEEPGRMRQELWKLMAVSGVVTCFVDFLTTETVTVTVPLLIWLVLRYREGSLNSLKEEMGTMAGSGLVWGVSYAFMFLLKWLLAAASLGWDAFVQAMGHAGERIAGAVTLDATNLTREATFMERLLGSFGRNQGCLFPFRDEMNMQVAMGAFWGVVFLAFAIVYLFRDKRFDGKMILLCAVPALVPYLRYAVLANHSYLHYFFTYRAQLVTVVAVLFCTWEFGLKCFFIKDKKKRPSRH